MILRTKQTVVVFKQGMNEFCIIYSRTCRRVMVAIAPESQKFEHNQNFLGRNRKKLSKNRNFWTATRNYMGNQIFCATKMYTKCKKV